MFVGVSSLKVLPRAALQRGLPFLVLHMVTEQLGIEGKSDDSESRAGGDCQCRCKAYNFDTLTLSEAENGDIIVKNEEGKTARVLIDNILASNAVIHLIDRVLF